MKDNRWMAKYLIGDVQGCDAALEQLLAEIGFSPSTDTLYLLGDLVNRGPDSLAVLRRLRALEGAAHCILGNHDLHCLAVAAGVRSAGRGDTLAALLAAPDALALLDWLRQRPMALFEEGVLMVHAGVLPQWDATKTIAAGALLTGFLCGNDHKNVLKILFGNTPARWQEDLPLADRLRVIVNALTRLRFCTVYGEMEFATKEGAAAAPAGYLPWFEVPGRQSADVTVAFGHWSTLGYFSRPGLISLDTGCVWGGCLSAMRFDAGRRELVQVDCEHLGAA